MEVYVGFAGLKCGFWLSKCCFINKRWFRLGQQGENEVFD